jgi:ribosome production factor 2
MPGTERSCRKPRNARTARIAKAREPQLVEDRKKTLLLHGPKCPLPLHSVLKTFHTLTKPHSILLNKKNENVYPFENVESLEFLASKNGCGLVVWGSSSKKRPNTTTILRIFDGRLLDMIELLLLPMPEETTENRLQIGMEMKPMILFAGSMWDDSSTSEQGQTYATIKSLFLDIFSGEEISTIDVEGLQYLLMIAAGEPEAGQNPVIHLRWYKVRTRKSGQKVPRVELEEVGPKFDFRVGRIKEAEASVVKEALRKGKRPDEARTKKNIETDLVGDKIGRVHLGRQDLGMLQTRKMKGLKRSAMDDDAQEMDDGMVIDEISEDEELHKKPRLA